MDECLLDPSTHAGAAAAPGFPFTLISYLQLALGAPNGFIHRVVT